MSSPGMANSRLEGIRSRLGFLGVDNDTISIAFDALEASTVANYQAAWTEFETFASAHRQNPFTRDTIFLTRYLADLVSRG